jgi:aspartyl-tRNA synthetase
MRSYIKDMSGLVGQEAEVCAWIDVRRDQGKMVFLDLRDVTGKVQAVVLPNHAEALEVAQKGGAREGLSEQAPGKEHQAGCA